MTASSGSSGARIWFTPVGSEILAIEGGQLWYGDEGGLGSVSDMSKCFTPGSMKFTDEFTREPADDEPLDLGPQTITLDAEYAGGKPCRHTVIEYDERGWGTCRLCWQPIPKEIDR